jgi:GrpB-like predicted nucleotidyltransferase (UPF0157 family)
VLHFREPGHQFLIDHNPDVQMHVVSAGDPGVGRWLIFHDRLSMHPDVRELYERTKRELATRRQKYVEEYADARSEVVEEIVARAREDQQPA